MAQQPALCCPTPSMVRNPLLPHEVPSTSTGTPTTPGYACSNPQYVVICGTSVEPPPTPDVVLTGQDCDGVAVPASGGYGELVQVVQAPGQVLTVRMCESDKDFELSCGVDPDTGHQVQTAYRIVDGNFELIKRWDTVTGAEWTGDPTTLESCGGGGLESDPIEMCDSGVPFIRWVVKKSGEPTGDVFDTDLAMQPYTVTDADAVTQGACPSAACDPTISSAFADDLSTLLPGHSIAIQKPSCCAIKVLTSAGDFLVRKGMTAYSTADFGCPVTVTAVEIVSGNCEVADIIVTTQKLI